MKRLIFVFIAGVIGSMGFGAGTVLIIYLTVFEQMPQTKAQGINLLFFLPCAVYSIICYKRHGLIAKKPVIPLALTGIIGACIGYLILAHLPSEILGKCFGAFLILLALKQLLPLKDFK